MLKDLINFKAGKVQSSSGGSDFSIFSGEKDILDKSSKHLVDLGNKGYQSACNKLIAQTLASVPIKLYYVADSRPKLTAYRTISANRQENILKKLNLITKSEIIEITEHPLLDLFANINSDMNYNDWVKINSLYMGSIGNSYNRIIKDKEGKPIELEPLLGEYVTPVATSKNSGKILYYLYKPDTKEYKYNAEDILHFRNYSPSNMLLGIGDLEQCQESAELYQYYQLYEQYLAKNNGRPDFAVAYKNGVKEQELKGLYKMWNKLFGGVQNSGKAVITTGEYEIKNLGFAPKDMQFEKGRQNAIREICSAYGVPETMIITSDANYASAKEAENFLYKHTIYPKMSSFCSKINEQLTGMYDSGLYIWFEENYVQDDKEKYGNVTTLFEKGIISKNEARSMIGLEEVEEDSENNQEDSNEE